MPRRISADRLRWTAHLAAITAYRGAFKAGRLGSVHAEVVDEAFQIAADELRNRAAIERRQARVMATLLGLTCATAIALTVFAHMPYDAPLMSIGVRPLALFFAIALIVRGESASTYRHAAKLLTPRAPEAPETARSPERTTPV